IPAAALPVDAAEEPERSDLLGIETVGLRDLQCDSVAFGRAVQVAGGLDHLAEVERRGRQGEGRSEPDLAEEACEADPLRVAGREEAELLPDPLDLPVERIGGDGIDALGEEAPYGPEREEPEPDAAPQIRVALPGFEVPENGPAGERLVACGRRQG